jgi:hypothetical protein
MAKKKASPSEPRSPLAGLWHFVSFSGFDEEELHEEVRAYLAFEDDRVGQFQFGIVQGDVDYREVERDGKPGVEFSWEGLGETEDFSGRGWAVLEGDALRGKFFLHLGEESDFVAERATTITLPMPAAARGAGPAKKGSKKKARKPTDRVYQLKITLKDVRPPIWRRVLVADGTLEDLHDVIQDAMGWQDSHLHSFTIAGETYSDPETAFELEMGIARETLLSDVLTREKMKFTYLYDFGDDWAHDIVVEKVLPREEGQEVPVCLKGKRACPPEDVGGPWGYMDYAEAIRDPKHERHDELLDWSGPFDPEAFDLDEINKTLSRLQ